MANILSSSNSEVLRLLGTRACSRLGLLRHVVVSGREALEETRRLRPEVVVLDVDMPEISGYDVCRQLKDDPELRHSRVMLVVSGILTRATLDRLADAGCDDAVVMPAIGEEFFCHIADMVGLPRRRSRRVGVELLAQLETGPHTYTGRIDNLSMTGARVHLQEPLGPVSDLRARIESRTGPQPLVVDTRVAWRRQEGRLLGLEFGPLTKEARLQLEALVLYEVVEDEDVLRVYLEGDITETSEFEGLAQRLEGSVEFDAVGVRYINSQGSRKWVSFLRSLSHVRSYRFSRCSVAFTTQASLLVEFVGEGEIISFLAPYHCDSCDRDEARLLQTAALVREGPTFVVPRFRCPTCGGRLAFDEIPERYLGFLE